MTKLSIFAICLIAIVGTLWGGCKPQTMQQEIDYPKPAASIARMHDWPLEYVVQHDLIFGNTAAEHVKATMEEAINAGHKAWAENVIVIQAHCWQAADIKMLQSYPVETTDHLPKWMYQFGENNPMTAIKVAAWENLKAGADWWLRDQYGEFVPIWPTWWDIHIHGKTIRHCILNWSEHCPVGVWDGHRNVNGTDFYLGDTRGKTILEWMCQDMRDVVINGSDIFLEYVDGILLEDGGYIGVPCWAYPDTFQVSPLNNGEGMSCHEYRTMCIPQYEWYMANMLGKLNKKLFFYINGHHTRDDLMHRPEYQLVYRYCNAPKVEHYGNWGGWPNADTPEWLEIWPKIEDRYMPYGLLDRNIMDRMQGDDMAIAQCTPEQWWSDQYAEKWCREHLAMTLINGSAYFSVSWKEDYFGYGYTRGDYDEWPNLTGIKTPYLYFKIGQPISEMRKYVDPKSPQYPLYYRYFERGKQRYTVVVNMWPRAINNIPPNDGAWFEGLWPHSQYERILLQK